MTYRPVLATILGSVAIAMGACADDVREAPAAGPAEYALAEMVRLANSAEWEQLCSMTGRGEPLAACMRATFDLGDDPPEFEVEVVGERTTNATSTSPPGRILVVCVFHQGMAVATEIYFISGGDDDIAVPHPHFWESRTFSGGGSGAASSPTSTGRGAATDCPEAD